MHSHSHSHWVACNDFLCTMAMNVRFRTLLPHNVSQPASKQASKRIHIEMQANHHHRFMAHLHSTFEFWIIIALHVFMPIWININFDSIQWLAGICNMHSACGFKKHSFAWWCAPIHRRARYHIQCAHSTKLLHCINSFSFCRWISTSIIIIVIVGVIFVIAVVVMQTIRLEHLFLSFVSIIYISSVYLCVYFFLEWNKIANNFSWMKLKKIRILVLWTKNAISLQSLLLKIIWIVFPSSFLSLIQF